MGSSWTNNANTFGLVGTGAGLCARDLDSPLFVITNTVYFFDSRYRLYWEVSPATDYIQEFLYLIPPGSKFPYGVRVDPP